MTRTTTPITNGLPFGWRFMVEDHLLYGKSRLDVYKNSTWIACGSITADKQKVEIVQCADNSNEAWAVIDGLVANYEKQFTAEHQRTAVRRALGLEP